MTDHSSDELQPREHRAGAWVLLIVGAAALVLGLYQWRHGIVEAFNTGPSDFKTEDQVEQERLDELKTKDTDGDGITDFDESYVFKTSPYLDDSDSDGISDKTELENGQDPNCPEGKDCGPLIEGVAPLTPDPFTTPVLEIDAVETEIIDAMLDPTPEQIRQLLIEAGVSPEELAQFDDETLRILYQESLQEAQLQSQPTNP